MRKILFVTFLLSSCVVGPDYKKPELYSEQDLASTLNTNNSKKVSLDWYKQYQDGDLNSLIGQTLTENTNVNIAISKLRQARDVLKSSMVNELPMIDLTGGYNYDKASKNSGYGLKTDYYQLGLDATWELDIWGANKREVESNIALYKAASANLDNVKLTMTAEVINNYFALRQAQEQLKIAERNLEIQKNLYRITRDKYRAGLSNASSYYQSKYLVDTTLSQIPIYNNQIVAYQNALSVLAGKLPNNIVGDDSRVLRKDITFDVNRLYEFPIDVVQKRPDVRAAEQQLISQNALVGNAIAKLYPNVSISAFFGYQSSKGSNLFSSNSQTQSFAPTTTLPILHWGQLTNNVELQKNIKQEYLFAYKDTVLNAIADIKNSYTSVAKEYESNQALRNALDSQIKVNDSITKQYENGLTSFSDVLQSQQNLLDIQNQYIASNATIYQNIASFYKAIGGGYNDGEAPGMCCEISYASVDSD